MNPGKFVLPKDSTSERAQFAHLLTGESVNITTPTLLNADFDIYVSIIPTGGDAYISVTPTAALSTVGKFINGEYSTIVRAGEYLGATASINVTPYGEL